MRGDHARTLTSGVTWHSHKEKEQALSVESLVYSKTVLLFEDFLSLIHGHIGSNEPKC